MQIFLSSAEADHRIAASLAQRLSAAGHRVIYPLDILGAGDNRSLKIGQALEKADAMVAVVSPQSRSSDLFKCEVDFALGSAEFEGHLISVLVGRTRPFPWILKRLPTIRFDQRTGDIEELANRVSSLLDSQRTGAPT